MFARLVHEAQQEHDREIDIEEARRWQEDNAINRLQSQNLSHDEYTQWLRTFNQQEIEKKIARGKAMRENLDPWRAKCIQDFREWEFNSQMAQREEWGKQLRAEEEKDVQAKAAEKQKDFQAKIAEKAKQAALEEEKRGDEKRKKDRAEAAEAAKRMTTTAMARKAALATDAEASNNGERSSRAQEQRIHTGNAESRKGVEPKKQLSQEELNERRRTFKETVDAASKSTLGYLPASAPKPPSPAPAQPQGSATSSTSSSPPRALSPTSPVFTPSTSLSASLSSPKQRALPAKSPPFEPSEFATLRSSSPVSVLSPGSQPFIPSASPDHVHSADEARQPVAQRASVSPPPPPPKRILLVTKKAWAKVFANVFKLEIKLKSLNNTAETPFIQPEGFEDLRLDKLGYNELEAWMRAYDGGLRIRIGEMKSWEFLRYNSNLRAQIARREDELQRGRMERTRQVAFVVQDMSSRTVGA